MSGSTERGRRFKAIVLCCALVFAIALSVEAAHVHIDGKSQAQHHCSICSGAHIALVTAQQHVTVSNSARGPVAAAREQRSYVRDLPCVLFNRPPPSIG
jgi:hypothetical protein